MAAEALPKHFDGYPRPLILGNTHNDGAKVKTGGNGDGLPPWWRWFSVGSSAAFPRCSFDVQRAPRTAHDVGSRYGTEARRAVELMPAGSEPIPVLVNGSGGENPLNSYALIKAAVRLSAGRVA